MSDSIISVRGLKKNFGERAAVDGIDFEVGKGEIFGLLGPNGAGKTTTFSILSTLLEPDSGSVEVDGHDVVRHPRHVRSLMGVVPQELALYPSLTGWDNLVFFGRIYGLKGADLKKRCFDALEAAGLTDRSRDVVDTYSGGMKRRLNIAAGLIHRPKVLLMDEPTVGVDPQSRNFIFETIEALKGELMTVLFTTHYIEEAERICDKVAIMDQGRIVAMDSPKGLIALLGKGVIHLQTSGELQENALKEIRGMRSIRKTTGSGGYFEIETDNPGSALAGIIETCTACKVEIKSVEVLEPNLESVFLHLTGRRLRD